MIGSGLVLALIVTAAILPGFIDSPEGQRSAVQEVENPPGLRIVQHARVPETDQFTVQGVVQNYAAAEWASVSIAMTVEVAGKKMNRYEGMIFDDMPTGSRRAPVGTR